MSTADSIVEWTVHRLDHSLGSFAETWDELRLRLFAPNPVLASSFIDALLSQFGTGQEWLCVLRQDGQVMGMCIQQRHRPGLWRSFRPSQMQIGPTLLQDGQHVNALLRALPGLALELDLLCCDPEFGGLADRQIDVTATLDHALTMHVELKGSFADYMAGRPGSLNRQLEKKRKLLAKEGVQPDFRTIDRQQDMEAAVRRYAQLEARGWKGTQGTALGSQSAQLAFYTSTLADFARRDSAVAWELWYGDRLAASRLAIREQDRIVILKTCYCEELAQFSPGWDLLGRVLEDCFHRWPGGRVEFYTNASEEQLKWSTQHRWIRHISYYRFHSARLLLGLAHAGAKRWMQGAADAAAAGQQTEVRVYRHPREFPAHVLQLMTQAQAQDVQFGAAWYSNLVDTVFADHPGVRFYVLERRGVAVAVLPLLLERRHLSWRAKALANYYTCLYSPVLGVQAVDFDLAILLRAVRKDHRGLATIQLAPMAVEAREFRSLQAGLREAGFAATPYFCFGNWHLPVDMSWTEYLASRRGKQRNTITRMRKKLAAEGGHLELVTNERLEQGIAAYEQVYAASWKQPEPFKDFVPGLIRLCAEQGWLRLGVAWLQDRPIAAQIWIVWQGRAQIYKVAYDEAFSAYSPGTLLTALLMEQVLDVDKVADVDYLIGDDPYKQTWMSHRRERQGLIAYNLLTIAGMAGWIKAMAARVFRRYF